MVFTKYHDPQTDYDRTGDSHPQITNDDDSPAKGPPTGTSIIGIYSVEESKYIAYWPRDFAEAIQRIKTADEFAGIDGDLPLPGTDMMIVC